MSELRPRRLSLIRSSLRTAAHLAAGRLHFPREHVGTEFLVDGEPWIIFREAVIDPRPGVTSEPEAALIARFHVGHMSIRQNIWFSWLPMLPILGIPGFRSKLWMYNRYGDFMGFYRWQTAADAECYANSSAMNFMTKRSLPGSVSFRILTNHSFVSPNFIQPKSKMAEISSKPAGRKAPPSASAKARSAQVNR